MHLTRDDYDNDLQDLYDQCKNSINYHVVLTMTDGRKFDGIIERVEEDRVVVLVGEDVMEEGESQYTQQRQRRRPMRYRRFRRGVFPFSTLVGLSLLPYPFIAPPYPYYNPYYPY